MIRDERYRTATILVADDQPANVILLERMLDRAGYVDVRSTTTSSEVLDLVEDLVPDIVLLDLHMPPPDGFTILERLRGEDVDPDLPVLVLTADPSAEVKRDALNGGAKDLLTKPFDYSEVLLRIRNLLTTRFLQQDLRRQNDSLDRKVRERTKELEGARLEALERLARAAEYRDDATGQHTRRVGEVSAKIARALGLPSDEVDLIGLAAPLHDIGKIGIPDAILLKPGRLTEEEREVMKRHTEIGGDLLADSDSDIMQVAERVARYHHERWDGAGYPEGLAGVEIPLVARIVAVADVFDALSYDRPYRKAWPRTRVMEQIRTDSGSHFDPRVVRAFRQVVGERPAEKPGRRHAPPRGATGRRAAATG